MSTYSSLYASNPTPSFDSFTLSLVKKYNYVLNISPNLQIVDNGIISNYKKDLIPHIYKKLVQKNSVKLNKNAKNIEKIAITDNYTVASKVKEMFKVLVKQKKFVFNKLFSSF